MERLVQVEFSELSIKHDSLKNMRLRRAPTWDELFEAIHSVVQRVPKGFCEKGSVVLAVTADSAVGGRCLLYAGLTWASLQLLVKNGAGINVGGIGIRLFGGPKGEGALALPGDPKNPNLSGGYHAWCLMERFPGENNPTQDDVLVIDFSYHWFKTAVRPPEQIVGPEQFLIASPTVLLKEGIAYQAHDDASEFVTNSLDVDNYRDELRNIFAELKRRIGVARR